MNFDWKKYLEFAEYIINNSNSFPDREACCRASVSRAYYAAFGTARGYLWDSEGKRYEGGDAHKKVREHLLYSGDMKKQTIANRLKKCQENRIKADYYDNLRESALNLAFHTITLAKKIIGEISELSAR